MQLTRPALPMCNAGEHRRRVCSCERAAAGRMRRCHATSRAVRAVQGPHHYLGGRFVPPEIRDKFGLRLPEYPGTAMCVRLEAPAAAAAAAAAAAPAEVHAMRNNVQDVPVLLDAAAAAKARPRHHQSLIPDCRLM